MDQDLFQFAVDPVAALERQVLSLVAGEAKPYPLPAGARELLQVLRFHKGHEHAKPLADLVATLHVTDREVKAIVKQLIEDFAVPIGSSRQKPSGYFLCITQEDFEIALSSHIAELRSIARRVRALGGAHRLTEVMGQLTLEMEKAG